MCGPIVAKVVQERVKKEGLRLSRRNFLRLGGAAAATLAVGTQATRRVHAQEMSGMVIDLSHPLTDTAATFPSFEAPTRTTLYSVEENGFYAQVWTFAEHSGTHMDAPGHFIAGGTLTDAMDPAQFVGPAVVVDIAARTEENADAQVTPEDLANWESTNGEIPSGAMVFMYSGWETRFADVEAFRNMDEDGVMHFPGFHPDAAQFLVEERDIVAIGVDTLSLDYGPSATFDTHIITLGAGLYGLENVANLAAIKDMNATVMVGIPRFQDGSGGPCRVLAMA